MLVSGMYDCTMKASRNSALAAVYVVDADVAVRKSMETLIRHEGWEPIMFASADEFLPEPRRFIPSCLVLDATLPIPCGLEVQRRVASERPDMPIIFITARSDLVMTVQAMKAGAAEFFLKPLDDHALAVTLRSALARSAAALDREARLQVLQARYASLSPREQQVMALVVVGQLNKQIGSTLGISEITVKAHRGNVTRKMQAQTLVDLVHMADHLRITSPRAARPPQ